MKYLYHVSEYCSELSDGLADVINNVTYKFPPNKAVPVNDDWVANMIMDRIGKNHGMVFVDQIVDIDKGTIVLDLEKAKRDSRAALAQADEEFLLGYVMSQQTDRMSQGRPPMPPGGRALQIVKGENVDLGERFGIFPVGWGKSKAQIDREREMESMKRENDELKGQQMMMSAQIAELTKNLNQLQKDLQ